MKLVTVIMPVHNGGRYLAEAIESVLGQDLDDFDLLVIDDGSTDGSAEVVRSHRDPRVQLLQNPTNLGVVATLNRGLDAAASVYVARMDADDVCVPERLSTQVEFMEENASVGVSGGWVRSFGAPPERVWKYEVEHEAIRCRLLFNSGFAHPTVMMRKSLLDHFGLRYDADYRHAEDYELWSRCAELTRMANIPRVLLHYRRHPDAVGHDGAAVQIASADRVRRRELGALGIEPTPAEAALHTSISIQDLRTDPGRLAEVERWLGRLAAENRLCRRFHEETLGRLLADHLLYAGDLAAAQGYWSGWRLFSSRLTRHARLSPLERLFLLKRGIRARVRRALA